MFLQIKAHFYKSKNYFQIEKYFFLNINSNKKCQNYKKLFDSRFLLIQKIPFFKAMKNSLNQQDFSIQMDVFFDRI